MGLSIRVEQESGVAVVVCSGVLQRDESEQADRKLWAATDWPGVSAVWDFRGARFDLSSLDVRGIAQFILERQRERPPARMAFVTPRDVDFGLARMFEVFREDSRTAFRVFRDYDEAMAWARPPNPGDA